MRFLFAAIPALLVTGCIDIDFGSSDRYQADFHYNFDLQPGGRLNIENINGPVEIEGWDQNKVEITGVKNAATHEALDRLRIDIHNSPSSIDIRTVRASGTRNVGARYTLRVPRSAVLDRIVTSNGSLHIRDMDGGGSLKTSNGSIRAEDIRGAIDAETSNSSVELQNIAGDVKARTSNGRIRAERISGECEAHTSNSSIAVEFDHAPKSRVRAETSNGGITVRLPGNTAARIEADTSNGSVTTDFEADRGSRGNHLETTINGGGPLIELTTRNGSISILRR
jgi:DUF4097 and DUF4098 domain-containing protein YvlB